MSIDEWQGCVQSPALQLVFRGFQAGFYVVHVGFGYVVTGGESILLCAVQDVIQSHSHIWLQGYIWLGCPSFLFFSQVRCGLSWDLDLSLGGCLLSRSLDFVPLDQSCVL